MWTAAISKQTIRFTVTSCSSPVQAVLYIKNLISCAHNLIERPEVGSCSSFPHWLLLRRTVVPPSRTGPCGLCFTCYTTVCLESEEGIGCFAILCCLRWFASMCCNYMTKEWFILFVGTNPNAERAIQFLMWLVSVGSSSLPLSRRGKGTFICFDLSNC